MSRRRRQQARREVEWDFFSFPVAFAFALGALMAILLLLVVGDIVFYLAVFGVSFGCIHTFTQWLRRRTVDRRRAREEEEERERRAMAARAAAAREGEAASPRRRRRRKS